MAESSIPSSQESLPLSQETFQCLLQLVSQTEINQEISHTLPNCSLEDVPPPMPPPSRSSRNQTSLPATTNWEGPYNFNINFNNQDSNSGNWIYSEKDKCLYVKKDFPCPVNFFAKLALENVFVRAMAVFTSPDSASDVVTRCVNHSMGELGQGIWEAEHIIRCESQLASYHVDSDSKRHSVIVPFENPPVGQDFSTYIYKFVCFNSCSGGPNRRPLTLIFTLENREVVLGRCVVHLKICASPRRDSKEAEKVIELVGRNSKKVKMPNEFNVANILERSLMPQPKKIKTDNKKEYFIKVKDYECYLFLRRMKWTFEMNKSMAMLPPGFRAYFQLVRSSDEEEKQ